MLSSNIFGTYPTDFSIKDAFLWLPVVKQCEKNSVMISSVNNNTFMFIRHPEIGELHRLTLSITTIRI